jgi:hypothetical protein
MSTQVGNRLQTFFADYERAFGTLDSEAIVDMYSDSALAASPGFVGCTKDKNELRQGITNAYQMYKRVGLGSVKILNLSEQALGQHFSMVTVRWSTTFQKTGKEPITFDVSYLVQNGEKPKIICFVSHEDEQEMMKSRGLIPV